MKFWELESVCRGQPDLMERLADRPEWAVYLDWYQDFDALVDQQDREKLDAIVPDKACVHVLARSRTMLYEGDAHIRTRRCEPTDRTVSMVDILTRYGGTFLEDVMEFGLARIPSDDAT